MHNSWRSHYSGFLLFLVLFSATCQAELFRPSDTVLTLSTPHFNIHFSAEYQKIAQEYAIIAEQVHEKLSAFFDWQPSTPTDVVIRGLTDSGGGYMISRPRNRIVINLNSQTLESRQRVFIHEYTHVMQIDQARGFNALGRFIVGRMPYFMPNSHQPDWLVEGLAEYIERHGEFISHGEQDNRFDMAMRVEVGSQLKSLAQLNFGRDLVSWPYQTTIYLYGKYFYDFIEANYGQEKVAELVSNYAAQPIPYFVNNNSIKVLGRSYSDLWQEFEEYLHQRFDPSIEATRNEGVYAGQTIRLESVSQRPFVLTSNESTLFYTYDNGKNDNAVYQYYTYNNSHYRLFDVTSVGSMDFHAKQGLLYSQQHYVDQVAWFYDLYIYDFISKESRQITHGDRCKKAVWKNDGSLIVAICHNAKGDYITEISLGEKTQRLIYQYEDGIINSIDWHPNQQSLLLSISKGSPRQTQLVTFDYDSKEIIKITNGPDEDIDARYVNEEIIVFSRLSPDGGQKIVTLNTESRIEAELTNTLGAAIQPHFQPYTRQLFFSLYGADGWNLQQTPINKNLNKRIVETVSTHTINQDQLETNDSDYFSVYQPIPYLLPTQWWPLVHVGNDNNQIGFRTFAQDSLERHYTYLQAEQNLDYKLPKWGISYSYNRWRTKFEIGSFGYFWKLPMKNPDSRELRRVKTVGLQISQQWKTWNRLHSLSFFTARNYYNSIGVIENDTLSKTNTNSNGNYNVASFGVGYFFSSVKKYNKLVNYARGIVIGANVDRRTSDVFDDYSVAVLRLDGYLPLIGSSVLSVQTAYGLSLPDSTIAFSMGGLSGRKLKDYYRDEVCCFDSPKGTSIGFGAPRHFPIRGYVEGFPGSYGSGISWLSAEIKIPVALIERNVMFIPLGFRRLNSTLFFDLGSIRNTDSTTTIKSAGIEMNLETASLYSYKATMNLGWAKGLDEFGESQIYFRVGSGF